MEPADRTSSRRSSIDVSYFARRVPVHHGPEAHELAGHGAQRHRRRPASACWSRTLVDVPVLRAWRNFRADASRAIAIGGGARLVAGQARRDDRHAADDRALQRHGRRRGGGHRRGRAAAHGVADATRRRAHGSVVTRSRRSAHSSARSRFSGSLIALGKLQGAHQAQLPLHGPAVRQPRCSLAATLALGAAIVVSGIRRRRSVRHVFFVLALLLGVTMTLPIGGADMPVVISLYNAFTGLAVAFEGFVLEQRGDDHRRHRGRLGRHAAHAADGEGDEPLARQRAVLGLRRERGAAAEGGHRRAEADRSRGRRRDDGLRAEGHRRAGLRHGRRAGAAQGLGAVPAADRRAA